MIGKWSRAGRRRRAAERDARQQAHREELAAAQQAADAARLAQARLEMVREELVETTAPLRAMRERVEAVPLTGAETTLTLMATAARPAARARPFACPFVPLAN